MPKNKERIEYIFAEIGTDAPEKVQLMRTIKAEHGYYGSIVLDKKDLRKFKENFDSKKRRTELAVDYSHMSHMEAAGWIKSVTLENNDSELWIEVEWTGDARQKILDKQYKYLSADFSMKHVDDETGEMVGQMLHGAGLTNRPFIRGMEAILNEFDGVELSEDQILKIRGIALGEEIETLKKDDKEMNLTEITEAVAKLSNADKATLASGLGLSSNNNDIASQQLSDVKAKAAKLEAENKKLNESIAKADKERKFDKMLGENKAVEAQREAYLIGDMDKFVLLAEEMNTKEAGTGAADQGKEDEPKTAEEAGTKLCEIAEELAKDGMDFGEAMSQAVRENEKLYTLSEKTE